MLPAGITLILSAVMNVDQSLMTVCSIGRKDAHSLLLMFIESIAIIIGVWS